jgi:hypothetical protein
LWLLFAVLLCVAGPLDAQRGGRTRGGFGFEQMLGGDDSYWTPPDFRGNPQYDGRFTFARIKYRGFGRWSGREGPGWSHDYPDAEVHLTKILREITSVRPFLREGNILGGAVVALDDPALLKYPIAYFSEPGGWAINEAEAKGLRNYLLKGGFVIFDDFPTETWNGLINGMQRALPGLQPVRMTGKEAIFDSFYKIDISKVSGSYGRADGFYAYYEDNDPKKRLLAIACLNNDFGEAWQWSGQGFVPIDVSNEAFKLGINLFVYALTH